MMSRRRDFIRKGLIGSAAVAIGGFKIKTGSLSILPGFSGTMVKKAELMPVVEVEETVYHYLPADNGAGPMWCHGSTCLVRTGNDLYASGLETIPERKILNNCRWMLFERSGNGWEKKLTDNEGRTREPSPMSTFCDGRFFLSANPTLTAPDTYNGPSRPEVYQFRKSGRKLEYDLLLPVWSGNPPFTEHSYRSFAADGEAGELIFFQNIEYTHAEWAFLDSSGRWSSQGKLEWPFGSDYEEPEPIRICYPNVMLKGRTVHFCGVSDIIEPNREWRKFKKELTGREWDYDFRRLFYTWSDNISSGEFHPWIEIASREETCGWITPCDLWIAHDDSVHLLWTERAIDERLRERFFPDEKQSYALNYAVLREGKVIMRRTLALAEEGISDEIPGQGRFHTTPGNRLFVVYFVKGTDKSGQPVSENRILEIDPEGNPGNPMQMRMKYPLSSFFTATVRAGSRPSEYIDMLGTPDGIQDTINYARIHIR